MLSRFPGAHWHFLMMKDRASEHTDTSVMAQETGGCLRAKGPRVWECEDKGASSLGYTEPKSSAADDYFLSLLLCLICMN